MRTNDRENSQKNGESQAGVQLFLEGTDFGEPKGQGVGPRSLGDRMKPGGG